MAFFSPLFNDPTPIPGGTTPASGYKLFTYAAGSSTKQTTYTDSAGTVPQSNPIILNASGYPTNGPIWLSASSVYKFVLTGPNDTDPPTSPVKTFDNIPGMNDTSVTVSQWQASGLTPTFVSTTSFTVPGDQTTDFHVRRKAQFTTTAGTVYGEILTTAFTTLTTVTMTMDSGQVLDSGLSVVNLSMLRSDHSALPSLLLSAFRGTAGTTASASAVATNYVQAFDLNSDFDPVTGIFTAPAAGVYEFAASGQLPLNANRGMAIFIQVNGSSVAQGGACTEVANNSPVPVRPPVSLLANLAAGDTVKVLLTLTSYTAGIVDYFWGKRLLF